MVQNDEWGASDGQCVTTNAGPGFAVTAGNHHKNDAPAAYPSIMSGCWMGTCTKGTTLPTQISQLGPISSSIAGTIPSGAKSNMAYDIWADTTPKKNGQNDAMELMIWLKENGGIKPIGNRTGAVSIGGANWDVWKGTNGGVNVISYVRQGYVDASDNLPITDFVKNAVQQGSVKDTDFLTNIQAGFEPWIGGPGLALTKFSVANGRSRPAGQSSAAGAPATNPETGGTPSGAAAAPASSTTGAPPTTTTTPQGSAAGSSSSSSGTASNEAASSAGSGSSSSSAAPSPNESGQSGSSTGGSKQSSAPTSPTATSSGSSSGSPSSGSESATSSTPVPRSSAPESSAPESSAPESSAPESSAPESSSSAAASTTSAPATGGGNSGTGSGSESQTGSASPSTSASPESGGSGSGGQASGGHGGAAQGGAASGGATGAIFALTNGLTGMGDKQNEGATDPAAAPSPNVPGRTGVKFTIPGGGKRTEVLPTAGQNFKAGDHKFFGYSAFLDKDFAVNAKSWQVIWQLHDNGVNGSPPVALEVGQGSLWLATHGNDHDKNLGPVAGGQDVAVQLEVQFAQGGGFVNVWRDGKQVVTNYKPPSGTMVDNGDYLKTGIYRDPSETQASTLTLNDLKIGDSLASVGNLAGAPTGAVAGAALPLLGVVLVLIPVATAAIRRRRRSRDRAVLLPRPRLAFEPPSRTTKTRELQGAGR